jgi:hypothetical protein
MSTLKDIFSDLKTSILGTSTTSIDVKLDTAVKDIVSYKSQSGRNGYIELVKALISKTSSVQIGSTTGGGIFSSQGMGPATFGQGGRIARYRAYESIVATINYCYRALSVLTDNILSPDDITKVSLDVKPQQFLEDEVPTESKVKLVQDVIKRTKLEDKLSLIIRNTLMFGDFFCEIADSKTALTSRTILSEAANKNLKEQNLKSELIDRFNVDNIDKKKEKIKIEIDYSSFSESTKNNDKTMSLNDLNLIFHEPKYVVKLQSSLFPICFGYLIFPQMALNPAAVIQDEPINNICNSILRSIEKKIPQIKDLKNKEDLKDIISSMIQQHGFSNMMDIRYAPPNKVVHFMVPSTKYFPYGESIFDSTQYTAKVLIALETALAVQRLSRSTEKRKISVEIGLPRDARKAVENLKEEFRKRKVSLDSFGTVDTIPSMITTFEDIYIPQKDGKAYVDVDTFTGGNVDIRSKVDELKFLRDQLVSSLGVPASFLNIEENLSNKAALSEENILFARTIVSHQKYLTRDINDLIMKIMDITKPEEALTILDNVSIALPAPKSLQFEREARYMSELANLVETLERLGIPKEYSKKKYLPQIDWKDVDKYEIDEKIDKSLDPDKKKEDEMDAMGGVSTGAY